jgi:hypothetical protein
MQRGHPQYAWKAWRDTIIAVVAVIAVGALASANPSLRAPRGPHESLLTVPTGLTGPAGLSGPGGAVDPESEPTEGGLSPSDDADFTACEGLTGLDNAICRHEALLVVHPDNPGLQHSLTHLQENKAQHEAKAGSHDGGGVASGDGSSSSSSNGHGQSGESHGNGKGDPGGNGKGH